MAGSADNREGQTSGPQSDQKKMGKYECRNMIVGRDIRAVCAGARLSGTAGPWALAAAPPILVFAPTPTGPFTSGAHNCYVEYIIIIILAD